MGPRSPEDLSPDPSLVLSLVEVPHGSGLPWFPWDYR